MEVSVSYRKPVEARTAAAESKTSPSNTDVVPLVDATGKLKKLTWLNLKTEAAAAGATGATGAAGATGATGAVGATGATGATGASGVPGATGATGASGVPGATGATGASGVPGATGATGASGASGASGIPAITGVSEKTTGYTLVLGDAGKVLWFTIFGSVTIPGNSSVAFPVGTTITVIAAYAAMNIFCDDTLSYLNTSGSIQTGSPTLNAGEVGTLYKVASTQWFLARSARPPA